MALFTRRESPPFYPNYREYKPFLRRDFLWQCAYCERTETYMGGDEAFEVEHFRPVRTFPELRSAYANLYYACRKCNRHKWKTWPAADEIAQGYQFADPCLEDLYRGHLIELEDGDVEARTPCGMYSRLHLRLHRQPLKDWRVARVIARRDLPELKAAAAWLETLMASLDRTQVQEVELQLEAIRRRIEDSRMRFSTD